MGVKTTGDNKAPHNWQKQEASVMHKDKSRLDINAERRERERQLELAQSSGRIVDNRQARRKRAAELRKLDKKTRRDMKAQGVSFIHG